MTWMRADEKIRELISQGYQYVKNKKKLRNFFMSTKSLSLIVILLFYQSYTGFADKNGTIFCVKAIPPKNEFWNKEVVKPMNSFLKGLMLSKIRAVFFRASTASSAQRLPKTDLVFLLGTLMAMVALSVLI